MRLRILLFASLRERVGAGELELHGLESPLTVGALKRELEQVRSYLEIEQARSAVLLAVSTLDGDRLTRELNASAAKNLIGRVARLVAEEAIQLHGGIAMTWEYALGHYAKRLTMIDHQLGDTDHHIARYVELSKAS